MTDLVSLLIDIGVGIYFVLYVWVIYCTVQKLKGKT